MIINIIIILRNNYIIYYPYNAKASNIYNKLGIKTKIANRRGIKITQHKLTNKS